MPPIGTISYTIKEEIANTLSHVLGVYVTLVFSTLIFQASLASPWIVTVGVLVYGFCAALMFTMSSAYHCIQYPPVKAWLRLFDHIAIYLTIAAFNTPISLKLISLGTIDREWLLIGTLAFQWIAVIWGTVFKLFTVGRYKGISTWIYLALGWACIVPILLAFPILTQWEILCIVISGMLFTIGAIFYSLGQFKWFHPIWHLFVLAASIFHFMFVMDFIR